MTNPFSCDVTFICESSNGDLRDYPKTDVKSIEFDATDASIYVYVEQFRNFLRCVGFAEKSVEEALGEE